MSIRILPEHDIKQAASSLHTPALLYANPKNLYARREKRLQQLAEKHPFKDYLMFAAQIVAAQAKVLEHHPIADHHAELENILQKNHGIAPLDIQQFQPDAEWRKLLSLLIDELSPHFHANETVNATLDWLKKASETELDILAKRLLNGHLHEVGADKAVFLWAALSLYWLQLAQQLPRNMQTETGERCHCPVCGSAPVAGVVHFGETQGLRYLHCALCESEWHVVRAKCSNCEQSGKLDYWSLDKADAPIKAESCGDCGSYLKILYQDKDPYVEAAADDLASLFLDAEMEEKSFARSAINPFLFPAE
ncbi:formate dehydrogenase accessory protein FdhE [Bibersteinia trehalosi]|uniref:formate dehydrogenase accessory protein FdhE n=1 Tax=Bibersteinia trehalosi TaxID=47735 RepID=UPI00104894E2|nr:formate dehydrogenase accessory protein FdhE [Bibersteinia trehalosi]TCT18643.1 Tat proofreading chaperone FdhE [Bibersteinia trehalosi]